MQLGTALSITPATLLGLSRFLTGTTDNTSAFSDTEITALLNLSNQQIETDLLTQLFGEWKPQGNIYVDDLTASKQEYLFPTDILTIDRLELDYVDGTNTWRKATRIKMENIRSSLANIENDNAVVGSRNNPTYWLYDTRSVWIDPVAITTVTDGFRIYFTDLVDTLADATDEPVYVETYHKLLAYDASIAWCLANSKRAKASDLKAERDTLFASMVVFYAKRDADERSTISPQSFRRRAI